MASQEEKKPPAETFEEALAKFKRNLSSELDNIFDEEAIKAKKAAGRKRGEQKSQLPRLEVTNFGVVSSFTLPVGWVESSLVQNDGQQQSRSRIFQHAENSSVQLCFFFRGHRVSEQAASTFLSILAKPDHFLKVSEFKSLSEIVRALSNSDTFKMLQSATRQMGNKKVLIVEGRFVQSAQDTYALFVDVDGSGTIVQEIHYQAPKLDYARHLLEVKTAMDTIQWRAT